MSSISVSKTAIANADRIKTIRDIEMLIYDAHNGFLPQFSQRQLSPTLLNFLFSILSIRALAFSLNEVFAISLAVLGSSTLIPDNPHLKIISILR